MRDHIDELEKAGAQLLVVDPHDQWPARHFLKDVGMSTGGVGYPLLLDPAGTVGATYGVAYQMRIHTERSNRPTTFLIDRNGVIRYARRAKSFSDRPGVQELLRRIRALE